MCSSSFWDDRYMTAFGSLMGFLVQQVIEIDGSSGPVGSYKKAIFGLQIVSALILSKLAPSVFSPPVMFQASLYPTIPHPQSPHPCSTWTAVDAVYRSRLQFTNPYFESHYKVP